MVTNFCEDANWVLYITDHKHTGFNTTKESSMTLFGTSDLVCPNEKKNTEGHAFWI
jgi:hypothetical protein